MAGGAVQYKVDGAKQLRRAMKRAGLDVADLRSVHKQIAELVVGPAKAASPVRTGRLRDSVRPGATQTAAIVRAGRSKIPYAGPIHWGWPARNIKAQPFLVEAAHDTESRWLKLYADALDDIIETIERSTP
jgi:hypothetical protein